MIRDDGPGADIERALAAIARGFGAEAIDPSVTMRPRRWEWRTVPFGRCPRCQWPANCLGPDGQPWHAFCWGTDTAAPAFDQWMRRKVDAGEWGKR
jgi:hypothetical protein